MLALNPAILVTLAPSLEGRSWVAFLQMQTPAGAFVKIEATKQLGPRMRSLDQDSPFEPRLIGLIETARPNEAARALQTEYQAARIRGDWFYPVLPLLTFIERGAQTDLRAIIENLEPANSGTISISELADRLGVSVPTIRRMVTAKQIPSLRVRGQHRFVLSEVLPLVRRT